MTAPANASSAVAIILLAEDSEDLAELMEKALLRDGHRVIRVEDGFELGDYLLFTDAKRMPLRVPDLLITDLQMPGRDGLEALRNARRAGLHFPALVVTAFPGEEVEREAKALGAVVIPKPADLDELREAVRLALLHGTGRRVDVTHLCRDS